MDTIRPCPICGASPPADALIGQLKVNHPRFDDLELKSYSLMSCNCSDVRYLSPLPSRHDIAQMYEKSTQFRLGQSGTSPYRGEQGTAVLEYITTRFLSLLRFQRRATDDKVRVLEVGAGLAWMCRAAKIANWDNLTVAQDLSDEASLECRWVDQYFVGELEELPQNKSTGFDLISMTHVLEHLRDPLSMLRELAKMLSGKGHIFITAPSRPIDGNANEIGAWESWSYNHTPAHIHYFGKRSLSALAQSAGLKLDFWDGEHERGQVFEAWLSRA